jgi:hypothetical protein
VQITLQIQAIATNREYALERDEIWQNRGIPESAGI